MADALIIAENPYSCLLMLLVVMLIFPPLFERYLRLPGLFGLFAGGLVIGPFGIGLLKLTQEPTTSTEHMISFMSDFGLLYLMFLAGLEIDEREFQRAGKKTLIFGSLTFGVPLITGTIVGLMFQYNWNSSILIGSLFSSHTLLGYPIVKRYGLLHSEVVLISIGATVFTDIGSLLVLAICVSIHQSYFSILQIAQTIFLLTLYCGGIYYGARVLGRFLFGETPEKSGSLNIDTGPAVGGESEQKEKEIIRFLFVMIVLIFAAVGAELANFEPIIGAFLSALALNPLLHDGRTHVKEKLEFFGDAFFVPLFFINMGLMTDFSGYTTNGSRTLQLTFAILLGLVGSKLLAAILASYVCGYQRAEKMLMWSLSLPQVGATLAATLVGCRIGALNESMLNAVVILMIVTSTVGPFLTQIYASQVQKPVNH